jgi:hypothetical protein
MRYVIVISIFTAAILLDGYKNEGRYLDMALRFVMHLMRIVGVT